MSNIQEYKCPKCGGKVEFDSASQKMKCPYCDSIFEIEEFEDVKEEHIPDSMEWGSVDAENWNEDETGDMSLYICNSCGGEIIADESTVATACPFCDSPVVLKGKIAGDYKPDYVIPFKLDKKEAKEALKKYYEGKKLLPKVFKDENHIDEIKGIYVPFWIFDADVDVEASYNATRTTHTRSADYEITHTDHYRLYRSGSMTFKKIPVDSSIQIQDEMMESIEPFNFDEAVPFKKAYLSGFLANRYDVNEEDCQNRANERLKNTAASHIRSSVVGYETVAPIHMNMNLKKGDTQYALYPVWFLNTKWNGKNYHFAMNGQTGKFVGELPMDKSLYTKYLGMYGAIAAVIAYIILYFVGI